MYICQYCGKDTSEVEYDYLSGTDHLSCALENERKNNVMEILSVKTMSNTLTEIIETTDGQKFILVQTFTNAGSELNYSVFDLKGIVS